MKQIKNFSALLSMAALLLSGCAKDGAIGPAGPRGAQGNANVISDVFFNQDFSFVASNNDYELYLNDNAITQTVLDQGAVLVYFQLSSNTSGWTMLPGTFNGVAINVSYGLGQVQITDGTMPTNGPFNFKIVALPPYAMKSHPDLNVKDFSAVQKVFNLPN
jgi:hypothetical protein